MDNLDIYLSTLFEGLEGYVYSPVKTASGWDQNWFDYPKELEPLRRHIETAVGDVYISPAVYSEKRATKDHIKKVQCVWVEFDGAEQISFDQGLEPNLIVQTSFDTHCHCYWRVGSNPVPFMEDTNRRLTHYLKADSSGWDATQLLRPPGTYNHKRDLPVVLSHNNSASHQLTEFDFLPKIEAPAQVVTIVEDLVSLSKVMKDYELPLKLVRMIKKEEPVEPYRSSFLARLSNELAEEGLGHTEIVSCLYVADLRIGKYSDRTDQLVRLSQLADYAMLKHLAEDEILLLTPMEILEKVDDLTWIIPNWLHTTGFLVLSAAPAVGKTQLAFQLAYCLNKQKRFLGFVSDRTYSVLFLSLEMDFSSLKYIINHQKKEWDAGPPSFIVGDEATSLKKYEDIIYEKQINVLVVDSLTELFDDFSENPSAEARRVMLWIRKVKRRYGCAIVLIHHNRKASESNKKPKNLADLAGSFQFGKEPDTVLQLWEDHKGIEMSTVKVRFGMKMAFMIVRNENLWFEKEGTDATKKPRTDRPDQGGDGPKFSFGGGH